jgi:integrase
MGELKQRGKTWWIRYYRNGKRHEESSGSTKEGDARSLLRLREGDIERGVAVTPKVGRIRFDEAVKDVLNDYRTNRKRSLDDVERRIEKHLTPFFGNRKLTSITTADIREYIDSRQKETTVSRKAFTFTARDGTPRHVPEQRRTVTGVSNGEINRELTALKRMFNLAIQSGKLLQKPHMPLLNEDNVRVGFFERDQFLAMLSRLPEPVRPVATFAYITGWRIDSEVLPLEWRQIDFGAGEIRLDPGKTKNGEGRTFPMTRDLRELLINSERSLRICNDSSRSFVRGSFIDQGGRSRASGSPFGRLAPKPDALAASCMTSVELQSVTWSAPASLNA